jgi:Bacterial Ig-like domain/Bacterial Ig domain
MSWTMPPDRRAAVRRSIVLLVASALTASFMAPLAARPAVAAADVGYQDGSYSGSAPTGREPQSKLWYNDGIWWASMWSSSANAVEIQRLNWATQTWIDTGVKIDERSKSSADTLWDGTNLYVISAVSDQSLSCSPSTSGDLTIRILRFTYSSGTKSYALDSGFPVTIANAGVESVAMAKDSTGVVWVTWGYPSGSHGNVFMTHSTTDTAHFATPFVLPLSGAATMDCSDYSAIVAYNGKIGVMWSNQPESSMYFGIHNDGDADTAWTRSTALSGSGWADNHVNLKSLQADAAGQVFAATKTSLNGDQCPPSSGNTNQPLIVLAFMDGTGSWQRRTVSTAQYCETRPLVVIDQVDRQVYVFATQPAPGSSYGSGGSIWYKAASLDNPNFADGPGTPFIQLAANPSINNVTSTKQPVSGTSGLVVLAADDSTHHYVHNAISIGGPDITPPTVTGTNPASGAASVSPSVIVTGSFSEAMNAATISGSTFTLTDTTASASVAASVTYDGSTSSARLTPTSALVGGHTYLARLVGGASGVTDVAGNAMSADYTWSFTVAVVGPVFSDGFESSNFAAWSMTQTGGGGTATVQSSIVKTGTYAARFTASTSPGSLAYARATLSADQNELSVNGDFQITSEGTSTNKSIPFFRLFNASGSQLVNLYRQDLSANKVYVGYGGTNYLTSALVPLNTWANLDLHVIAGSGNATVEVRLNGTLVYQRTTATLAALRTIQIGNNSSKQPMTLYVDNILASAPGVGPTPPDTTITAGPTGTVSSSSASFSFTSSQPSSTFGCSLDGGSVTSCSSPATYTGLGQGAHTFTVAATASGLTDPTPASRTWTVDTIAPTVTAKAPADGATGVAVNTVVTATFSEPMAAASITSGTFTLIDVTNGNASVPASVAYNAQTWVATLTPSAALAASHNFTARVLGGPGGVADLAGNTLATDATWSFATATAADTTPPTVTLTAPANGASVSGTTVTLSATASDNVAVDHVDFLVNGTVVNTDTSTPYNYVWDSTGTPNGSATITARAVDTSTNQASDPHSVTIANGGGGGPVFSDDFESGTFFAWTTVRTGADGTATVQNSIVKSGLYAGKFTESATSGSLAYARATLAADQTNLTVSGDFQITAEGTSAQNVPILRLFDSGGTRRVSLYRQSASGNKIYVGYNGTNYLTTGLLPLATWGHFDLHIVAGTGTATVEVRLNGALIYSSTTGTVPVLRTIQVGNETGAQPMGLYVDNIVATGP